MTEIQNSILQNDDHDARTTFTALVDEASDALHLDASEEEKERLGHFIVGAWEDLTACTKCGKDDDATLACARRTLVRENGVLHPAVMRCERYYAVQSARRTARLFGTSHLGERFRSRTFDTFCPEEGSRAAYDACRTLAESFERGRRGLLIAGGCGSGKTHLAASVVHSLVEQGFRAMLMTTTRFLETLKGAFGDSERTRAIRDELYSADLLVLDDVGAEHMSDWARSELFSLLNERYETMKTTILTTNLSLAALTNHLGERTVSRIAEMTDGVRITAGDRRLRRHTERRTP